MERIYPVDLKRGLGIRSWHEWPDDVRQILWDWNHGYGLHGKSRLSFSNNQVFKCIDCNEFCQQHNGAVLDGDLICDHCLIEKARKE